MDEDQELQPVETLNLKFTSDRDYSIARIFLTATSVPAIGWTILLFPAFSLFWWVLVGGVVASVIATGKAIEDFQKDKSIEWVDESDPNQI